MRNVGANQIPEEQENIDQSNVNILVCILRILQVNK